MRMLRNVDRAARGAGRILVTDNWYSSGDLMANICAEFKGACGCGVCFFCKHRLTHGVEHKSWHFGDYKPTPPPSNDAVHPWYPQKRATMGDSGDCEACVKRGKKEVVVKSPE